MLMTNALRHGSARFSRIALLALMFTLTGGLAPGVAAQAPGNATLKSITVVTDSNFPPFMFRDSAGELQGILKDTWALWQARTGVAVNLQAMDWASAQQFIQAGRADVIDLIFDTPARDTIYDFSAPYATVNVPIFFHRSVSGIVNAASLKGFTVGVKDGDACAEVLQKQGIDTIKPYPSYSAVIAAAAAGDLRVFCMDEPPAVYLLNQRGIEQDFRQSPPIYFGQFHRAVRKGNKHLMTLLDDGFARITAAEYQAIEDKWRGAPVDQHVDPPYLRYARYVVAIAVLLALLLGGWSHALRRQVRARTADLTRSLDELRAAQTTVQETSSRLLKIAGRVPGMVYQYLLRPDGSGCMPFASDYIQNIYRMSPQSVQEDASAVFAIIHPDDIAGVVASIQASADHLTAWHHEYRVKYDDGGMRWLSGNALPERLPDGSVLWHGFITDITERKKADEKLRQFSRIVQQAPMAIVITDLAGNIEYINPQVTHATGYTPEDVYGQNPRIMQSGLTPPETYQDMWATLLAGGVWQGELENRKKNGEFFAEQAVLAPVVDADGQVTHYVALKQDITERRRVHQALETSLKEKVALLNEVHHRVKNNLQVITSLLRLEAGRSNQPDTKLVLKEMKGRIRAMALLHETLYRSGNFAAVDLGGYLKQLATQAFRAQSNGLVRLNLQLDPVQVSMDLATPCGLLVNELISNGLKHAFPPGRTGELLIELRAQPSNRNEPPKWRLQVRDNGIGLPADFDERREHSLGLQLVSDLVQQIGGKLVFASEAGTGTTFSVAFAPGVPPTQ
jgi:PAS domain S-box-containing protein